jgi:hypothetical protein
MEPKPNIFDRLRSTLRKHPWTVMLFICLALGVFGIFLHNVDGRFSKEILGNGLMLAGACFFVGGLCGFLFGIPHTVQNDPSKEEVEYRINTNLEQISDWLTKIIVGLTLVNLQNIPPFFTKLALDVTPGMGGMPDDTVFAGGVVIYFLILGFLAGFITTRTRISSLFSQADATLLFSRRDTDLLRYIAETFEADRPLSAEDIKDLQIQISKVSRLTQNSIFAYTKNCRKLFHKRCLAEKEGLTAIVFEALVEVDYEGLNHEFRSQLGYALKDQHLDKTKPWDEATEKAMIPDFKKAIEMFETAIEIRGDWKSKGNNVYELNLAITKVELLELMKKYPDPKEQSMKPEDKEVMLKNERKAIQDAFKVAWQSKSYQKTISLYSNEWFKEEHPGKEEEVSKKA